MNGNHPSKPVTITSAAHSNRTLGGVQVASKAACLHYIDLGFSIQRTQFELRRPEQMVSDLANPQYPVSRMGKDGIMAYHKAVNRLLDEDKFREFRILGDHLDTEIAVHAESISQAQIIKNSVHEEAIKYVGSQYLNAYGSWNSRGLERCSSLETASLATKREYSAIKETIASYYHADFLDYLSVLKINELYRNHAVWKELHALGSNFVFVLNSGVRLYLSMFEALGEHTAIFVEIHRENDAAELFRKQDIAYLERGSVRKDKTFVIVDIAYTGGTVLEAKKKVCEIYGPGIKTITVGVFPKTLEAVLSMDYSLYAGRLLPTRNSSLKRESWMHRLLEDDQSDL